MQRRGKLRIPRRETMGACPLSFGQQRLWFLDQVQHSPALYNVSRALRVRGPLDLNALKAALDGIVARHEVLRTTFTALDGVPMQVIGEAKTVDLPVVDLTSLKSEGKEETLSRRLSEEAQRPFDLSSDLMLRAVLVQLERHDQVLLLVTHHIASDAWSMGILLRELAALYTTSFSGTPSHLPEVPVQYADFALWQRQWLQGDVLEEQLSYWMQQLRNGIPVLDLPTARSRPPSQGHRGGRQSLLLPAALLDGLKGLSRREGVTLFMTLLAAFQTLLHRYTGQGAIAVGTPIAGRRLLETENLVGFFVNTLVMRANLGGNLSFRELLAQVKETALGAYAHQDLPFEKLVEELRPDRDPSRNPFVQVVFQLKNVPRQPTEILGLEISEIELDAGPAKFDLSMETVERADGLLCSAEYDNDIFDESTIRRMLGHYRVLLEGVVSNPGQRLSELPLLTEEERHRLLVEWNDTKREYPRDRCIHELFEHQVDQRPNTIALALGEERLTYASSDARANQLARYLRRLGVGRGDVVGLYAERSFETVIAMLAILKAGGAYMPLDPTYPRERLALMVEDSRAKVLLTQERLLQRLPVGDATVTCLDTEWEIAEESVERLENCNAPLDPAYVMYTSGSTGTPKGVVVPHRAVLRLVFGTDYAQLDAQQTILQLAPVTFDASTLEIWGSLLHGGRCVLFPGRVPTPEQLEQVIQEQGITALWLTASLFNSIIDSKPEALSGVRQLLTGGEALSVSHVRQALAQLPSTLLVNGYGPTESTTFACCYRIPRKLDPNPGSIPIGKPIDNTKTYILDDHLQPVPIGIRGELYIGGDGLAIGYLNSPELTAERFIPNPFSDDPGARLFKTGDLARYLPDGNIEFLGRIDHQVKIRGFRIELGEIEAVLAQHPKVKEVVVAAREDTPGDKRLVGYVVPHQGQQSETGGLRSYLSEKLPEYMVPSAFVLLDSLPLTPNGKVDRDALPVPQCGREDSSSYVPPRTPIEEQLAGIWGDILGIDRVGINDNFFELGGHSLLAVQLVARIREALHVEFPLETIFASPTVASLAECVKEHREFGGCIPIPPIRAISRDRPLPLSFPQEGVWVLDRLAPGNLAYNAQVTLRLTGELDLGALNSTLTEVVRRHEILRTSFPAIGELPVQVIHPPYSVTLPIVDLQHLSEQEREAEAERLIYEQLRQPFDVTQVPLIRWSLLRLGRREHVLVQVEHHLVHDGWSLAVLLKEIKAIYDAFSSGRPSPLPEPPLQFGDFAVWQRSWMKDEVLESQLAYWQERLQNAPSRLDLPTDRRVPAIRSLRGGKLVLDLPAKLCEGLRALSHQHGATLFMTLLAAFKVLLYRYTHQEDILVGSGIANRRLRETEDLIGMVVNTVVLRSSLDGDPPFHELLERVRDVALEAYAHQDLPFEKLVQRLQPERIGTHNPLFQVMFSFHDASVPALECRGLSGRVRYRHNGSAKFDLNVIAIPRRHGSVALEPSIEEDAIRLEWEFSTDIFDESTIRRMLGHYRVLLEGVVSNPGQRLSELPLLTEEERHRLLVEWNRTEREYPRDRCIHELFEEQVERTPEVVAVVYGDDHLTFRELNARANRLAHHLRGLGVGPERLVGICVERSLEMVVGLLGILKAGGAYVPLDPGDPKDRLGLVVTDAQLSVLLTQKRLQEMLPEHGARVVCLDTDWERVVEEGTEDLDCATDGASAAYVMYTSGSTGNPKGVVVPHRAVARLVVNTDYVQLGPADVVAQVSNSSFDALTFEVWGALLNGARLVIIKKETALVPSELGSQLNRYGVTTTFLTTAWFNLVACESPSVLGRLRHVLFGGEAGDPRWIREVLTSGPPERLLHMYGPTEATTFTTWHEVGSVAEGANTVPIGRPIANARVYLLDSHQHPVPVGVAGELYVGGDGLASSYLNRPELTEARFVADPFRQGDRLYRTGDLARYLRDGSIEFLGRIDQQVKIRGYRVELGEVEAALNGHPGVREAVVLTGQNGVAGKRLVAYVVAESDDRPDPSELRQHLRKKLPEYMVPSAFAVLDELPLMPNGKVDRRALQAMEMQSKEVSEPEGHYVAPEDELELRMMGLWEEVLDIRPIGVETNFFELGGHSLLAVQLFAEIEKTFGRRLPLATLFEGATIRQLASRLRGEIRDVDRASLVSIQPDGSRPPLFFVHGVGGEVLNYRNLALRLGPDQPVYGLQARGLDGSHSLHYSIEDAAASYVEEIRDLQPMGPYYLAGFSAGGVWAFEVARQLHAQGEQVAMLALFDTGCPGYGRLLPARERARRHWKIMRKMPWGERLPYVSARVTQVRIRLRRRFHRLGFGTGPKSGKEPSYATQSVDRATWIALDRYTPQRYAGRIDLFWAEDEALFPHFDVDPRLGWSLLAERGVQIHEIAGDHAGMIREPAIQDLAEGLRACLREAREDAEREGLEASDGGLEAGLP